MIQRYMQNLNIDFIKPAFAVFVAWGITLTGATEALKFSGALVALAYAILKLVKDFNPKRKNDP